jgi:hypothetical protein
MLPGPLRRLTLGVRTTLGSLTRPVLIRITEEALDRYPDRTVALVRARLERASRRRPGEPFEVRRGMQRLMVRAMDVHPAVARALVRHWLRRAARNDAAARREAAARRRP